MSDIMHNPVYPHASAGLLRTVFNAARLALGMLWTAACISLALLVHVATLGRTEWALRMAAWLWAPGLLLEAGAHWTVEGRERVDWSRNYLIVANHQSIFDICALFIALPVPVRFLLKQEMKRVPFVNWYAKATGMLFVAREDRRAGPVMRREAAELLGDGRNLLLFPEGTRSRSGALGSFKSGSFQSAIDAGVEVLPVAVIGTGAIWPVAGFRHVRGGPIRVRIGAPVPVHDADGTPVHRQALARQAQDRVQAMLLAPVA